MRRVLRREKSGYTFGLILCMIGLILLAFVTWKMWLHMPFSQDFLSDLWSHLWTEPLPLAFGVEIKLVYFAVLGVVTLLLGAVLLALSQKWFVLSGATVLKCPYCKNQWRASRAKGRSECPYCRQFVQPEVVRRS